MNDSQQSFDEVWKSSFPESDVEKLFPELGNIFDCELGNTAVSEQDDMSAEVLNYLDSTTISPTISENSYFTDLAGFYGFEIDFGSVTDRITKSTNFTYSKRLNKLFVRMEQICPIKFKCSVNSPLPGCLIRAIPVFKKPEHFSEMVTPCLNHKTAGKVQQDSGSHLVHVDMPSMYKVTYTRNAEGRNTVSCLSMLSGADYSILRYKFTCLSSCKSGINKRPVMLTFVLESPGGIVLGRRSVNLCVCTCPGRDRVREEIKLDNCKPKINVKRGCSSTDENVPSKVSRGLGTNGGDDQVYTMRIMGREKYERLLKIKEAFDLEELVSAAQREDYYKNQS